MFDQVGSDNRKEYQDMASSTEAAIRYILANGDEYTSSEFSQNNGNRIRECFFSSFRTLNPRRRGVYSSVFPRFFDPGLASARFFFHLRGEYSLETISFYAPKVMNHSDDGERLSGSAYGAKIFSGSISNFSKCCSLLKKRPNTKRAAIPLYTPEDVGRKSVDIPCAFGLFFFSRSNTLISSTVMRANDAAKLMIYNQFEFSLIAECVAANVGLELGPYIHNVASHHIRGDKIKEFAHLQEGDLRPVEMKKIVNFDDRVRAHLLQQEEKLRNEILSVSDRALPSFLLSIGKDLDEGPWRDMLFAMGIRVRGMEGGRELGSFVECLSDSTGDRLPLTHLQAEFWGKK